MASGRIGESRATTLPEDPPVAVYKSFYGLRVDFDTGTCVRLYIMHDVAPAPKKPRKKFRKRSVDSAPGS